MTLGIWSNHDLVSLWGAAIESFAVGFTTNHDKSTVPSISISIHTFQSVLSGRKRTFTLVGVMIFIHSVTNVHQVSTTAAATKCPVNFLSPTRTCKWYIETHFTYQTLLETKHNTINGVKKWYYFLCMNIWSSNLSKLPGCSQGVVLHRLLSESSPTQSNPDPVGSGAVQDLVLDWVPGPQVAEHSVHELHSDHPPSTEVPTIEQIISIKWRYQKELT